MEFWMWVQSQTVTLLWFAEEGGRIPDITRCLFSFWVQLVKLVPQCFLFFLRLYARLTLHCKFKLLVFLKGKGIIIL